VQFFEFFDVSGEPSQVARAEQPKRLQAELSALSFERIGHLLDRANLFGSSRSGWVYELWCDSDSTTWAVPQTGLFFLGLSMQNETVFLSSQLEDGSVIETSFARHWWPTVLAPSPYRLRPRVGYHHSRVRTTVLNDLYQEHRNHLQHVSAERNSPPRSNRKVAGFEQLSRHRRRINWKPFLAELLVGYVIMLVLWLSIVVVTFPDKWMPAAEGLPGLLSMVVLYRLVLVGLYRRGGVTVRAEA